MLRLLLLVLAGLLASPLGAQEKRATVQLENGEVLVGRVLAMDLATLKLQVGHEVHTLAATSFRSCRIEAMPSAEGEAPPAAEPAAAAPTPVAAAAPETRATGDVVQDPAPAASKPRITWQGPLPDPVDPEAEAVLPHDLRHRSRWRARLELIDEAYPWLAPTAPSQWVSLGLLLTVSLSLVVYLSVRVAGAEAASLGSSLVLALWYMVTTVVQAALVPVNNASVALMLLANPSFALFGMSAMFGLPRSGAVIAYAIQLGFVVLGYGVLELVNALLASIGATA
jgi:hypothetical protein